ncbi:MULTISPECIES: hypothetical protein [unclassified Saccharibacter]|uniref:HoxN/HupN/NixA family nickel/cobalt transporter n=1 Tax=unclassified Saccharibacter TaxID=2648722 RepID=UPI001321CEC6|nr:MULTISPECIES: hypothetical protein [unclassified Saccharibacter]MXV36694.1 hypothetical protein [Saccharibacter sp. EH611]MXV58746.1 hypothetical protein [Saccharibacter sp. EH70]MXV65642.1 hypothetical protein [Saccharibacter sp. EH60]
MAGRAEKTVSQLGWLVGPVIGNLALWGLVGWFFTNQPVLLGVAALAYGTGIRHALDADHLASIDSALRLDAHRRDGSASAGLFFSLGHSTIVVGMCVLIFCLGHGLQQHIHHYMARWAVVGTIISTAFLLFAGSATLLEGWRDHHAIPWGVRQCQGMIQRFSARRWGVYLLGFLFALGFDTTAEIGVLGVSATQSMQGVSVWRVLLLPCLFAAGMILMDTLDGLWAWRVYRQSLGSLSQRKRYRFYTAIISSMMALLVSFFQIYDAVDEGNSVNTHLNIHFYGENISINIGIFFSLIITMVWFGFLLAETLSKKQKISKQQ